MSYRIAPALRAIATSPAVTVFTRSRKNCRYEKVAPVGYFFHWSCRDHLLQRIYTIRGSLVFSVSVGGRPGTADIDVIYRYAHADV